MRLVFTVTNDLSFDQRMHRICESLATHGHVVTLVGRHLPRSKPLEMRRFRQWRLYCFFKKGPLFYAEFNLRLFFYLLFFPFDAIGTVDLDTLPASALASWLRRKKRVFDAHEHFTEVPEVTHRPFVKAAWHVLARLFLPLYRHAYTVGPALAMLLEKAYGLPFAVVRNMPRAAEPPEQQQVSDKKILLYQGALNEGRGIEALLEAMTLLPEHLHLWLAGEGDLSAPLRRRAAETGLDHRVTFLGMLPPSELRRITPSAWLGLNLLENRGLSYYYSLANKFFDYVQASIPSLGMQFPEYQALNDQHEVAVLLPDLLPDTIAQAVLRLNNEAALYQRLTLNCQAAALEWVWENEEKTLLAVWDRALN